MRHYRTQGVFWVGGEGWVELLEPANSGSRPATAG